MQKFILDGHITIEQFCGLHDSDAYKILEKYTKNKSLDLMSYFEDVFLKNIDIWGFTMIYVALYEYLYESFNELNEYQMKFMTKIKYIIIHFLYENPTTPINVSLLANELTSLNELIEKFEIDKSSKKLEYVSILRNGGFTKNKKIKTRKLKRGKKRSVCL